MLELKDICFERENRNAKKRKGFCYSCPLLCGWQCAGNSGLCGRFLLFEQSGNNNNQ